jgi:hypothetical protein
VSLNKLHLLLLSLLLALAACQLNPTEGLRWNTDLLVPLAKSEVSLQQLVQDTSPFHVGNDQLVSLILRDTFASTKLIDLVELPDTNVKLVVGLDSLELSTDTISERITLADIARQLEASGNPAGALILANHGGLLPLVPAVPGLSSDPIDIDASEFFEFALLDSGELVLSLENQLPLPIQNVILFVTNKNLPGPAIVADTFVEIPSQSQVTRVYDLAGKEVESQLQGQLVNLDIGGGIAVPVDTNDYIEVSLIAKDLKARTATAVFPEQTLLDTTRLTQYSFEGEYADIRITKLVVKSGKIEAESFSTIEDTIAFFYSLPGATNVQGEEPSIALKLDPAPPGGVSNQTNEASLGGFTLDLSDGGTSANQLLERIEVRLVESGNLVTLDRTDSVSVSFGLTNIEPTYVEGYIGQDRFVFSGSEAIDIFEDLDLEKLSFANPSAEIVFANSLGLDAKVEVRDLRATNKKDGTSSRLIGSPLLAGPLVLEGPTLPDTHAVVLTRLPFDVDNSNIARFVNLMADELTYDLNIETNFNKTPQDLDNFATDKSEIAAFIEFRLPLQGQVGGLKMSDQIAVDFSEIDPETEGISGGELTLLIDNQFPLQMELSGRFLDENLQTVFTLATKQIIQAGQVDANGRVDKPTRSEIKIAVEEAALQALLEDSRFLEVFYEINTQPTGEAVGIYDDYRVLLKLVAAFSYELTN